MIGSRRLALGAEVGLAAVAALLLVLGARVMITIALDEPGGGPDAAAVRPAAATAAAPEALDAYAVIAERDIFNGAAPTAATRSGGFRLHGIGVRGDDAWAILDDGASRKQHLVRVGDTFGDGRLTAVAWDHVTILRGQREETLLVSRDAPPHPPHAAAAGDVPPPPTADAGSIRQTTATSWIVDRHALANAAEGMSGLMTQLRAVPEVEDGRPVGFRLFQIDPESLFARLGLHSGDVVQRVNGKPVTEPASLLTFLKQLKSEPRVALDVVRSGAGQTLVYDLR